MDANQVAAETDFPDALIGVRDGHTVRVPVGSSAAGRAGGLRTVGEVAYITQSQVASPPDWALRSEARGVIFIAPDGSRYASNATETSHGTALVSPEKGPKGDAATVQVAGVTTASPGTPASVTNVGTSAAASLQFVIPKGERGDPGPQGEPGDDPALGANDFRGSSLRGLATDSIVANSPRSADYISVFSRFGANVTRRFVQPTASALGGAYTISAGVYSTLQADLASFAAIGCRTIIVLTPGRSGQMDERRDSAWWASSAAKTAYATACGQFAQAVKGDKRIAAIAVINEPFNPAEGFGASQAGTDQIIALQEQCFAAIRAVDQSRVLIAACGSDGSPAGYATMRPVAFDNVVYDVHFYQPYALTHSQVEGQAAYAGAYPGATPLPGEAGSGVAVFDSTPASKSRMRADLQAAIAFGRRFDVPMLVGEFAAARANGPGVVPGWTQDAIELFEELGWSWCHFGFWFPPSEWSSMELDSSSALINFNNGVTSGQASLNSLTGGSTVTRTPMAVVGSAMEANRLFTAGQKAKTASVYVEESFDGALGRLTQVAVDAGATAVMNSTAQPYSGTKHARFTHNSGENVRAFGYLADNGSGKACLEYFFSFRAAPRRWPATTAFTLFEANTWGGGAGEYFRIKYAPSTGWVLEVWRGSGSFNDRPQLPITGMKLPMNRYTGLKVAWLHDTSRGRLRVWQDGKLLIDINTLPTVAASGNRMWMVHYGLVASAVPGVQIDVDDVKLSGDADVCEPSVPLTVKPAQAAPALVTANLAQGVKHEAPGAPAIILSAHTYDASHFGITSVDLNAYAGFGTQQQRAAAPDCTGGFLDILDKYANWKGGTDGVRPLTVQFGPGVFKTSRIAWAENQADVFYQKLGLVLQGAGSAITAIMAADSNEAALVSLGNGRTNYTGTPVLRGLTLAGAQGANPNQAGVVINPEPSNVLGFGGLTNANWSDIQIKDFACEQLIIRGGTSNYLVPVQYSFWDDFKIFGYSLQHNAVLMTGQIGPPWNMRGLQVYGQNNWRRQTQAATSTAVIPISDTSGIVVGHSISGPGVPAGTFVQTVNANSVVATQVVSVAGGAVLVFGAENPALIRIGLDRRTGMVIAASETSTNALRLSKPHRFKTGDPFRLAGGTGWGGLSVGPTYYAYTYDDYRIRVCASLEAAIGAAPVFIELTSVGGTSTISSAQADSFNLGTDHLVFDTPTVQGGGVGIEVDSAGLLSIVNLHAEDVRSAIKTTNLGHVSVHDAFMGNAGQGGGAGCVFDDSLEYGGIVLSGKISHNGVADRWSRGNVDERAAVRSGSSYPASGPGSPTPDFADLVQFGNDIAPGDSLLTLRLGKRRNVDALLNTGTNVVHVISHEGGYGETVLFTVWSATGNWVSFGELGNIDLGGKAFIADGANGATLRVPTGARIGFTYTRLNRKWVLTLLEMPTHQAAWDISASNSGTRTLSVGATITVSVAAGGARAGDLRPEVSLANTYPGGVVLDAIPGDGAITVRLTNVTTSPQTLSVSTTAYVRQNR